MILFKYLTVGQSHGNMCEEDRYMKKLEKILEEMKESSITVATSKEHYIHPQDGRFVEEVVLLDDIEKIIHKHMNDG